MFQGSKPSPGEEIEGKTDRDPLLVLEERKLPSALVDEFDIGMVGSPVFALEKIPEKQPESCSVELLESVVQLGRKGRL
ncbi:MAG: hypothetical protein KAX13_02740 [Candidatus Krumholzibacteria bacterium]|nr:hypothetical protein [Candidatus Krumholzibacteria bacterium]